MRRDPAIGGLLLPLPLLLLLACSSADGPGADDVTVQPPAANTTTFLAPEPRADPDVDPGREPAAVPPPAPTCAAGTRAGPAGAQDGLRTPGGVSYTVRTPAEYDARAAHPLLVVFAPAGGSAATVEQATGLTADARRAGLLIAYVDHVSPTDIEGVADIAHVPQWVAERWCVDTSRIYLAGAGDGGSVIYAMLLNPFMTLPPAAIAPSGAGVSAETLAGVGCVTAPMPVLIMHTAQDDERFPGYGAQARDWWLACDGCGAAAGTPLPDGCLAYAGCADGVELRYCAGDGGHGSWAAPNTSLIEFLTRYARND